ncbi:hypothetical protein [Microbulbifer sediminum]|uniref:hypothetical protein n=1 Tax=Microbulbifer sediminum TaxID=2904250 RepID=UPI001F3A3979|nr:hypothetical protein [Microbulbifer sediminum]
MQPQSDELLSDLKCESAMLLEHLYWVQGEMEENKDLYLEVKERSLTISEIEKKISEIKKENMQLKKTLSQANRELSRAKAKIEQIRKSTSWRLTGPIRVIKRFLSRQQ